MIEIKDKNQYNQYNENGVRKVRIEDEYVVVNDDFKCDISNFLIKDEDVFLFGKKVSKKVAKLFLDEANKEVV